ncbi:hypothetical protein ES705_48946 [subsurface metagenome]|jgi:hypothetical protein
MPYLRGKKAPYAFAHKGAQPAGLQNQINRLKTQVGKNTPETKYFRFSATIDSATSGNELSTINATQALINSTSFRDNINGERWSNVAINLNVIAQPDCTNLRVMIYVPKRSGESFSPSLLSGTCYTRFPDPGKYWVLADKMMTSQTTDVITPLKMRCNLKGLKTILDSNATAIEKGEIKIAFFTNGINALAPQISYSAELVYHDN